MNEEKYDSRNDTMKHICLVQKFMKEVAGNLLERAEQHDNSKLHPPEKEAFDSVVPKLKGLQFGSDEYIAALREMKLAIEHHNAHNSHHPEHYDDGILGMSLLDLMEMLCDWKAAQQRHDPPGTFAKSMEVNVLRFQIPQPLERIIWNTLRELGWEEK